MTIEQIISLLKICGFALWVPLIVFMIEVVIAYRRFKNAQELPDLPDPQTTPQAANNPLVQVPAKAGTNTVRRFKGKKQAPVPTAPIREPTVTERIPSAAQKKLEEIWSRFPQIPDQWAIIFNQEDTK